MNEKHREVHSWLESVFGGETVPHYEVNARTIELLHQLQQTNQQRDKMAAIVTEDLQQKAEEYKAEADRIASRLSRLGLSPDALSQSGSTSLNTLTDVAMALDVKDTTDSSLFLGMSERTQEQMALNESRREQQKQNAELFSKTKTALQRLNNLKTTFESLESDTAQQGPELHRKGKEAAYLQTKAKEYRKHIQQYQLELTKAGADPSLYHQTLVRHAEELQELRQKLQPLRAKLDSYEKLPPDLSLSRVKLEEAKLELAALEKELSKHIDMMHL